MTKEKKYKKVNSERGFIQNIVLIAVIVITVFLSQQPYVKDFAKNIYSPLAKQVNSYLPKISNQFFASIYLKVGGEASSIQLSAQKEITAQKNNAVQNAWDNFKNYFAGKFNKTFDTQVK